MRRRLILVLLAGSLLSLLVPAGVDAQTGGGPLGTGSPSPRTAPVLAPGVYDGTLLTGETLWFAVLIADGAEIDLGVELLEDNGRSDLELEVAFLESDLVSPIPGNSVKTASRAREPARLEGTATVSGTQGEATPWNLRVTLRSDGRVGEALDARMTIRGTEEPAAGAPCGPPCPLEANLEALDARIEELRGDLDAAEDSAGGDENPERAELEAAIDADRRRLDELEAELANVPDGSRSDSWPVARFSVLAVVAAALLVAGHRSSRTGTTVPGTGTAPAALPAPSAERNDTEARPSTGQDVDDRSTTSRDVVERLDHRQHAVETTSGEPQAVEPRGDAGALTRPISPRPGEGAADILTISHGATDIVVTPGQDVTVGRDPACDLYVQDRAVSRRHARFAYRDGAWTVIDLDSVYGTFLDGNPANGAQLSGRSTVVLGDEPGAVVLDVEVRPPQE